MASPRDPAEELEQLARSGDAHALQNALEGRFAFPPPLEPIHRSLEALLRVTGRVAEVGERAAILEALVDALEPWLDDEGRWIGNMPPGAWQAQYGSLLAEDWYPAYESWVQAWESAYRSALSAARDEPADSRREALRLLARVWAEWCGPSRRAEDAHGWSSRDGLNALRDATLALGSIQSGHWQAEALAALMYLVDIIGSRVDPSDAADFLVRLAHDVKSAADDEAKVRIVYDLLDRLSLHAPPSQAAEPPPAPSPAPEPEPSPTSIPTTAGGGPDAGGDIWLDYVDSDGQPQYADTEGNGEAAAVDKGVLKPDEQDEVDFSSAKSEDKGAGDAGEVWLPGEAAEPPPTAAEPPPIPKPPPAAEAPPRYADFTFFSDQGGRPGGRVPEGHALQAGQAYHLEVAVRVTPTGIPSAQPERRAVREPQQAAPVTIMVTLEGDGFEIEEPVQTVTLPPAGDSTRNALFLVRPLQESAHANALAQIRVRLYYQFNLLEVAVISAEVAGKFDDASRSQLGLAQPIAFRQERLEREYLDLDHVQPRAMHVDITRRGDHYLFHFAFYNDVEEKLVFSAPVRLKPTELEDKLVTVRNLWYDIAMSPTFTRQLEGDPDEFRADVRRLAKAGRDLWRTLFRSGAGGALFQVGEWLQEHPLQRDAIVQVSMTQDAGDFVFPWALMYDRQVPRKEYELPDPEGFWGVRYCIEQQLPMVKGTDDPVHLDQELIMGFMLWEQFRNVAEQKKLMARLAEAAGGRLQISTPPITDADAGYELLADCDAHVLYFYTHGYTRHRQADIGAGPNLDRFLQRYGALPADSPLRETYRLLYESIQQGKFEPDRSWIELTYGKLYLDELYDTVDRLPSGPFVMLNMCESAQVTPSLSDSFIHFFLDRGARAVIGTECPMTVEFAHPFAERFLEDVLSGTPLGSALLNVRRHFMDKKNPLGLAYTLFGLATVAYEPPRLSRE